MKVIIWKKPNLFFSFLMCPWHVMCLIKHLSVCFVGLLLIIIFFYYQTLLHCTARSKDEMGTLCCRL